MSTEKPSLVDSHCHLNCLKLEECGGSIEAAIATAKQHQVERILNISIDLETVEEVIATAEQHKACVRATVGVHPTDCQAGMTAEQLIELADHPLVIGIGETGLDYFHDSTTPEQQQLSFRTHIQVANQLNKPLIIHTRQAKTDTLMIMREEGAKRGVMHCFTEDLAMAEQAIELGFYVSFSGIVTFKNARELQAVAAALPLDRILVETDAPYLAPMPYRGKSNQPAYTFYVAEKIAELKGVSFDEVAQQTTANFDHLFAW